MWVEEETDEAEREMWGEKERAFGGLNMYAFDWLIKAYCFTRSERNTIAVYKTNKTSNTLANLSNQWGNAYTRIYILIILI